MGGRICYTINFYTFIFFFKMFAICWTITYLILFNYYVITIIIMFYMWHLNCYDTFLMVWQCQVSTRPLRMKSKYEFQNKSLWRTMRWRSAHKEASACFCISKWKMTVWKFCGTLLEYVFTFATVSAVNINAFYFVLLFYFCTLVLINFLASFARFV